MFDLKSGLRPCAVAFAVALALSGCGGGGSSGVRPTTAPTAPPARPVPPTPDAPAPPSSISDDFEIKFNDDTRTWGQNVSGTGQLIKQGTGRLILKGTNTYTGGTLVAGGTVEVAAGATLGSGTTRVGEYTAFYYDKIALQVDKDASLSNYIVVGLRGTLDNAGEIGGNVDVAVGGDTCEAVLGGCPTILNHDGGSIQGTDHAVQMMSIGFVKNTSGSTIEGGNVGVWLAAGSVTNDGAGSAIRSTDGIAIQDLHGRADVENTGGATITAGATAIHLQYGGSVSNGVGSTIETTGTNHGDCNTSGDCSIFASSDLIGGLTLTNEGTIIGDVQLAPTAYNDVTLWDGSLIRGYLDMGTKQGSFFNLNGGASTVQRYSDAVTGTTTFAGLLSKDGVGSWIIDTNDLDHVVEAYVKEGTLQIGDGGTSGQVGSATSGYLAPTLIQIASGAQLVFDRSDDVVYRGYLAGLDSGPGGLVVQMGTGDLKFPDLRWIEGLVLVVEHGSVTLGDGSPQNDYVRPVSVTNNATLTFDTDGEVFDSVISGSGSLIKHGPGMLSLVGANTYTGGTTVNGGTLRTLKTLPGDVAVNAGGALDGFAFNGPSPGFFEVAGNLSNAGTVAVHGRDSSVVGNYVQSPTGTLAVSLGSKLTVLSTATLNGGTLEVTGADSGYVSNTHTKVLTAGPSLTGTFDRLVKDSGVVFTATTINYDANSVWLDTTGLDITTAAAGNGVGYTPASMGSAQRVQGAFEQLNDKIASGSLSGVSSDFLRSAGQFQQAPSLQAAQASLQSLSGQLHAASAAMTFRTIDASSRALSDRFDNLLGKGTGFGTWTQNLNAGGDMARTGFDSVGYQLNGWMVGGDRRVGHSGVAGYAFSRSRGQQRLDRGVDHDNSRSTEGMLYAGWLNNNWYTQGRVGFGYFQQDVSRQILLGESAQGVQTQYNGKYDVAYGESGLHFDRGHSRITPFVNAEYARISRGGFAEAGAGGFGLRSNAQTLDRWQAGLGVRAAQHWDLGQHRSVDFSARAQWQRTLASRGDVFNASFVGVQEWQPLVGIGLSRYSGLVGVGLNATLSARTALKFNYDYEAGQNDHAQMLSAQFKMMF